MEKESSIEAKLCKAVRAKGGLALKIPSTFHAGIPDRLCLMPQGRAFFVEVKRKGQKPRALQALTHASLRRLGFVVHVLDDSEHIATMLEEF